MGTETMIDMARKITPSPAVGIYLLKVNNRNTRTWCERCQNDVVLVSLLLTLNIFHTLF